MNDNDGVCINFVKSNENNLYENNYQMNELIFERIHFLGVAYNLSSIKWWDEYSTVRLNQSQVMILIEDLNFVKSVVNDPVVHSVIHQLMLLLEDIVNCDEKYDLLIKGN